MIRVLVFLFLLTPILAYPSQTSETQSALLRHLFRRSIGCYSGCSSCNSCSGHNNYASCPSTCNTCIQNCCQNNCQLCHQPVCYQNSHCYDCCNRHCAIPPVLPPTIPTPSSIVPTPSTPTIVPPIATPDPVVVTQKNEVNSNTNVKTSLTNVIRNLNTVHVPITINNVHKIHISNKKESLISATSFPVKSTISQPIPTSSPVKNEEVIIMHVPYQGHYVQPMTDLPCMTQGSFCDYRRPYWTGSVCGECSGCKKSSGNTWRSDQSLGFSSGIGLRDFDGCRTFSQNCGACGQDFYNSFTKGSPQFNSCYGCFI